jgi:hypothetical protein
VAPMLWTNTSNMSMMRRCVSASANACGSPGRKLSGCGSAAAPVPVQPAHRVPRVQPSPRSQHHARASTAVHSRCTWARAPPASSIAPWTSTVGRIRTPVATSWTNPGGRSCCSSARTRPLIASKYVGRLKTLRCSDGHPLGRL